MPNTFGHVFRVTTFGESHGRAVGCVVDGMPPGVKIDEDEIQAWMNRRRPGQSHLASPRKEKDTLQFYSGVQDNLTLGTPILMMVENKDFKPAHYDDMQAVFRPSHADFTSWKKHGLRPLSGGGRASARETIGRVAAAALAEQFIKTHTPDLEIVAWVSQVKDVFCQNVDEQKVSRADVDSHPVRCPDAISAKDMEAVIVAAQKDGDTVGGSIRCVVRGVPAGLGEPVFDKLEADLAKAMMSLPASKGFEIGSGFAGTRLHGSEHNDAFVKHGDGRIGTKTNRSGGIQGGITNGENITMNIAFKPVSTIFKEQDTVNEDGEEVRLKPRFGRHDPCVLPRAVPMVESMVTLVLMDHLLRHYTHGI